jgi:hypothetical protein
VEEVLDVLDALHLPRPLLEILDQLRLLDLAAEVDLAVLGVDVDLALRDVGVAEDLGLNLPRQRNVVGLRLRLLLEVLGLLHEPLCLCGRRPAELLARADAAAEEARDAVTRRRAAAAALLGVEEVGQAGAQADQAE